MAANYLRSAWIENEGNGNFTFHELPRVAQLAPLFGLQTLDLDADGYEDLIAIGNDYGAETGTGMQDALNGLLLRFDPTSKQFTPVEDDAFFVPGNGRSLTVVDIQGQAGLIAAENQGPTYAYTLTRAAEAYTRVVVPPDAQRVVYTLPGGGQSLTEVYHGSGYLSQRSRTVWLPAGSTHVEVVTFSGQDSLSR